MADRKLMLAHGRNVLRSNQDCDEASLKILLTERFLLQEETIPLGGLGTAGIGAGIFFLFFLPVFICAWISFRKRLRHFDRDLDAVILALRQEGLLTLAPKNPTADRGPTANRNKK